MITIIVIAVLFLILTGRLNLSGLGITGTANLPSSPLSKIFGNASTLPGVATTRQILPGYVPNSGIIPGTTPVINLGGIGAQVPTNTAQGKTGTGLSSAPVPPVNSGAAGNLNTNSTPAPTPLPGYAGTQPLAPCGGNPCLATGYPQGEQPYCLLNNCSVKREPCAAPGTSCSVTPYTGPNCGGYGACYCLPGYCGPAPVCFGGCFTSGC